METETVQSNIHPERPLAFDECVLDFRCEGHDCPECFGESDAAQQVMTDGGDRMADTEKDREIT